jgi:hypothetical protein
LNTLAEAEEKTLENNEVLSESAVDSTLEEI